MARFEPEQTIKSPAFNALLAAMADESVIASITRRLSVEHQVFSGAIVRAVFDTLAPRLSKREEALLAEDLLSSPAFKAEGNRWQDDKVAAITGADITNLFAIAGYSVEKSILGRSSDRPSYESLDRKGYFAWLGNSYGLNAEIIKLIESAEQQIEDQWAVHVQPYIDRVNAEIIAAYEATLPARTARFVADLNDEERHYLEKGIFKVEGLHTLELVLNTSPASVSEADRKVVVHELMEFEQEAGRTFQTTEIERYAQCYADMRRVAELYHDYAVDLLNQDPDRIIFLDRDAMGLFIMCAELADGKGPKLQLASIGRAVIPEDYYDWFKRTFGGLSFLDGFMKSPSVSYMVPEDFTPEVSARAVRELPNVMGDPFRRDWPTAAFLEYSAPINRYLTQTPLNETQRIIVSDLGCLGSAAQFTADILQAHARCGVEIIPSLFYSRSRMSGWINERCPHLRLMSLEYHSLFESVPKTAKTVERWSEEDGDVRPVVEYFDPATKESGWLHGVPNELALGERLFARALVDRARSGAL